MGIDTAAGSSATRGREGRGALAEAETRPGPAGPPEARQPPWLVSNWPLIRTIVVSVAIVAVAGYFTWLAYDALFSNRNGQDDDGYILLSLKEFFAGQHLYDELQSQYGPGLFTFVGGVMEILGVPFTSDGARFVNLALWIASTALIGWSLLRLTRSALVTAGGTILGFWILAVDANEPLHPGSLLAFLLLGILAAAAFGFVRWPRGTMALIGALIGVMLSIKINIGGLALISVVAAAALMIALPPRLRFARVLVLAGFVLVPLVLLSSRFDDVYTVRYASIVATGALALVLVSLPVSPQARPDLRDIGALAAGLLGAIAVACIYPILRGTSLSGLIDGWLVEPASMSQHAYAPWLLGESAPVWAVMGLIGAGAVVALRPTARAWPARWSNLWFGLARIAVGITIWICLSTEFLGLPRVVTAGVAVAAPFCWIVAISPPGDRLPRFVRLLLPALAVLQSLHAFPVAGSQTGWSNFLFVLIGGMCLADGSLHIRAAAATWRSSPIWQGAWQTVALVPAAAFALWFAQGPLNDFRNEVRLKYESGESLALAGTTRLHLPADQVAQLGGVVDGIESNCDSFITLPGLNSFYLYTGQEPPVVLNGPWPFFFTAEQQREIVSDLRDDRRLCVVRSPFVLAFWTGFAAKEYDGIPQRPLIRFIDNRFKTVADYGGILLDVRR